MTGRSAGAATEKDCPVRLTWLISTGVDFPFTRETVLLAVSPTDTEPKSTVPGDATRVPCSAPETIFPPQPDSAVVKQPNKIRSRAAHQPGNRHI